MELRTPGRFVARIVSTVCAGSDVASRFTCGASAEKVRRVVQPQGGSRRRILEGPSAGGAAALSLGTTVDEESANLQVLVNDIHGRRQLGDIDHLQRAPPGDHVSPPRDDARGAAKGRSGPDGARFDCPGALGATLPRGRGPREQQGLRPDAGRRHFMTATRNCLSPSLSCSPRGTKGEPGNPAQNLGASFSAWEETERPKARPA